MLNYFKFAFACVLVSLFSHFSVCIGAQVDLIESVKNNKKSAESGKYKYTISVCSIFKDEAPYLKEWIEYNKLIGVEHFRLYNNDSTDNYLEVLEPYIKKGEVVLIDWPGGHGNWVYGVQGPAMLDAVRQLSGISKWLAIIDIDEFILPTEHVDLASFLKDYERFAGVIINWQNYGTSWIQDIPSDKLLIEMLVLKAAEQTWWNQQVKSIVKPECIDITKQDATPHLWKYLPKYRAVTPSKRNYVKGIVDIRKIRINHYVHRSESYFYHSKIAKKERMEGARTKEFIEEWHKSCNEVEDKAIYRFVPLLREKIFSQKA